MLLQIRYQDKATQTDITENDTLEKILKTLTTLSLKVDSMGNEIEKLKTNEVKLKSEAMTQITQQCAEKCRSEDNKIPEIKGDIRTLQITHNVYQSASAGTSKGVRRNPNMNTNKIFYNPFIPKTPKDPLFIPQQTITYLDSLNQDKKAYNHITRSYIENIHKIQTDLNLKLRATSIQEPNSDYITQKLQGYNKLIALPKTNPNLVKTCFSYGLLNTVYTQDGSELSAILQIYKAITTYKKITKGNIFFVKFYTAPAEILYDEIKLVIQVVKIGMTRDMIIPEDMQQQVEIPKIDIPDFYANKRIIEISTIIQELANNYLNGNSIWSYYSRDQLMIYSNSRELRQAVMEEVQRWIMTLLNPEKRPTTRAIKEKIISDELLTRYCKLIGHKYPDHLCLRCNREDNIIPKVQLE
ncbi:hypothetical protein P3S68_029687 [Capsicum galapagoense]